MSYTLYNAVIKQILTEPNGDHISQVSLYMLYQIQLQCYAIAKAQALNLKNLLFTHVQWNLSKADTIGTNKIVHHREGVLWSGVYYTLCGLYLGFGKCLL